MNARVDVIARRIDELEALVIDDDPDVIHFRFPQWVKESDRQAITVLTTKWLEDTMDLRANLREDAYDPWAHLKELPVNSVIIDDQDGLSGSWCQTTGTIRLHPALDARERRSVLAHEIVHVELEHLGRQSKEVEEMVRETAARRLVRHEDLVAVLSTTEDVREQARALNCRPVDIRALTGTLAGQPSTLAV